MRYVLRNFEYTDKDPNSIWPLDPQILGPAEKIYEPDELIQRDLFKKEMK